MKNVFRHEEDFNKWLIGLRRYFHQFPELSFEEFNTQKKIMETLDSLGIENRMIAKNGVIATITGSGKGKTIAIRADMDALKISEEKTALNECYISENKGIMHACGHDGHMAMVLGAAQKLQERRNSFKGNVKLIFQPAEEVPPGGAAEVIKMGGIADVDAILGLHLFTNIDAGKICLKEGALMASNCKYDITINGKSGHHFSPDDCIDPILIASEFIATISKDIKQKLPATARYVFGHGIIKGGEQFNQTPESVVLSGSYRMLDQNNLHMIEKTMRWKLDSLMQNYRKGDQNVPNYHLKITHGYPVLVNHQKFTQRSAKTLKGFFAEVVENIEPVFASEDFARYLETKPGTFIFLGARNEGKGTVYGNHSNKFDIDENVLIMGVEIFFRLAIDFLEAPEKYLE